jgi:hypothetical protein
MTTDKCLEGTECRERYLIIPPLYSQSLRKAILLATKWESTDRLSPVMFINGLKSMVDASGFANQGSAKHEPLPEWATKVHEYLSKAEKISKSNP